jgi:hypothetical protein
MYPELPTKSGCSFAMACWASPSFGLCCGSPGVGRKMFGLGDGVAPVPQLSLWSVGVCQGRSFVASASPIPLRSTLDKLPPTMPFKGTGPPAGGMGRRAKTKDSSARFVGWSFVLKRARFFKRQPGWVGGPPRLLWRPCLPRIYRHAAWSGACR